MKITIHPLFFIFGLYFALTGKVFLFLTFTLTALIHELGHSFCAERLGYKMNEVCLMPYGTVVNGSIEGLSYKDEIRVAFYGPLFNLGVCVFFVCLWWLVPESYPYLDTVVFSNLCIFAINLLPAYPLDGGRILSATLSLYMPRKKSLFIVKILGVVLAILLLALFIYSLTINQLNISILFFSLFILFGTFTKSKENSYVKILYNQGYFERGILEEKRIVIGAESTVKELIGYLQGKRAVFCVTINYPNGTQKTLDQKQTQTLLSTPLIYEKIKNLVN